MNLNSLGTFWDWLCLKIPAESTRTTYLSAVKGFCERVGTHEPKAHHIGIWLGKIRAEGLSPGTERTALQAIHHYYDFSGEAFPDVKSRKNGTPLPKCINHDELRRLMAACDKSSHYHATKARAMLSIMYSCGLRRCELASLRLSDINVSSHMLRVQGKGGKERMVPISSDATKRLLDYLILRPKVECERLWLKSNGKPLGGGISIYYFLRHIAERAGLKDWHPHKMRHTFATCMLNQGANIRIVQELLGHANLATTQVYTYVSVEKMRQEYAKYHPPKI